MTNGQTISPWWWTLTAVLGLVLWFGVAYLAQQREDASAAATEAVAAQALADELLDLGVMRPAAPDAMAGGVVQQRRLAGLVQTIAEDVGLTPQQIRLIEQSPDANGGRLKVSLADIDMPSLVAMLERWRSSEPGMRVDELTLTPTSLDIESSWFAEVRFVY